MMGRTHAYTGLAAGLAVAAITGTVGETPILAYGVAAGAALLPDLDQHKSIASRYLAAKPAHFILKNFTHRRFTHSILGVAVFALVLLAAGAALGALGFVVSPAYGLAALAGYASHLVADAFNKQGIQLLYPFAPRLRLPGLRAKLDLEWWSIPLPRALRISTIYDPQGLPFTLGRLQARINTEKLFFRLPVYALIAYVSWHQLDDLVLALRHDVWAFTDQAPEPLARLLAELLS